MNPLAQLADAQPELIWGLVSRGLGLTYFISFASLAPQVLPIAGRNGITPIGESLRAIERDFPTWKRFFYFPTLLWLNSGDAVLGAMPWLGMAAAALVMIGGPAVPWAFAVLYLLYLSLERPVVLVYPWDCLLTEAGFWAMFLPATEWLPEVRAVSAPLPAIAWVYRLLVFRLILGFGKHKFIGTTPADIGFLKGFLVNQPLPTAPGWLAQKLPMGALRVGLWSMFLVEIVLPWTVFVPGTWSAIGALSFIGLMVGIELTGNFGYFNVITCVLSLTWFDTRTALAFRPADLFSTHGPVLVNALILAYSFGAVVSFPFNTFCAHTWMNWPFWERIRPRFLTWHVRFVRALHPFHWLHAYGVFPPRTVPSVKIVPVVEVSWDGEEFIPLSHPFSPTVETSRPRFCAPHHERFDQAVVYEAIGLNEASTVRNIVGRWDPYGHGGVSGALMFVHRILRGDVPGRRFYDRSVESGRGRPLVARVRTYLLEPASLEERRAGKWWKRTLIGPHFPPMRLEDGYWEAPLPAPELWHPDDVVWLRRSHLGDLMTRAEHGENVHDLMLVRAGGFDAADVQRFWDELVPAVTAMDRNTWTGLRAAVDGARAKYGRAQLHRFERIAARYAVLLSAKLAPLVPKLGFANGFGFRPGASTPFKTEHHVRLFAYHVLASGRATYDALVADPARAIPETERLTMCSALYMPAFFRYEAIAYQCVKLRLMAAFSEDQEGRPPLTEAQRRSKERADAAIRGIIGSLHVVDFLKTQMKGAEDVLDVPENVPRFRMDETGEVRPVRDG